MPELNNNDLLADITGTPTEFDLEFVPMALDMIEEFGKLAVFSTTPQQGFDPTKGEAINIDPLNYIRKISPPFPYEQKYIDGNMIQQDDCWAYLASSGLNFTPLKGMSVTFDRLVFKIMTIKPIYSGEQICLFLLQLRK